MVACIVSFDAAAVAKPKAPVAQVATQSDSVWVTRPDGSLQCDEKKAGIEESRLARAKTELEKAGVEVIASKRRNDGKMRAQMCGMATGDETSFQISATDLPKAKTLGFELLDP